MELEEETKIKEFQLRRVVAAAVGWVELDGWADLVVLNTLKKFGRNFQEWSPG